MSRSDYTEDFDDYWPFIRYRGSVVSATRGKRGQDALRAILEAMEALPAKELIPDSLVCEDGVCALGALAVHKGIDVSSLDPDDAERVAETFNIAPALAREIVYMNDEAWVNETPSQRYERMYGWVKSQIKE